MPEELTKPGLQTASGNLAKTKAPVLKAPTLVTDDPTPTPKTPPKKPKAGNSPYFRQIQAKATSTDANRTILMAVGIGTGIVLLARISGTPGVQRLNDPGDLIKIGVGAGATTIGLMVIAEVAPDVAIGFAWLILVGALLTYGVDFAQALSKGTLSPGIPLTALGDPEKGVGKLAPGNGSW